MDVNNNDIIDISNNLHINNDQQQRQQHDQCTTNANNNHNQQAPQHQAPPQQKQPLKPGQKPRGRRKKIRTELIRPVCPQCEKQFSNQSALTKHKLTHSDERKFACQQCSKAFKRHDHLTGHMQTHSNRKPFNCTIQGCDKTYCDARSLRRHKENIHHIITPRDHNNQHHHQQQQQQASSERKYSYNSIESNQQNQEPSTINNNNNIQHHHSQEHQQSSLYMRRIQKLHPDDAMPPVHSPITQFGTTSTNTNQDPVLGQRWPMTASEQHHHQQPLYSALPHPSHHHHLHNHATHDSQHHNHHQAPYSADYVTTHHQRFSFDFTPHETNQQQLHQAANATSPTEPVQSLSVSNTETTTAATSMGLSGNNCSLPDQLSANVAPPPPVAAAPPTPTTNPISTCMQPITMRSIDGGFLTPPFSGESFSSEQLQHQTSTANHQIHHHQQQPTETKYSYHLIESSQQQHQEPTLNSVHQQQEQQQQSSLYMRRIQKLHSHEAISPVHPPVTQFSTTATTTNQDPVIGQRWPMTPSEHHLHQQPLYSALPHTSHHHHLHNNPTLNSHNHSHHHAPYSADYASAHHHHQYFSFDFALENNQHQVHQATAAATSPVEPIQHLDHSGNTQPNTLMGPSRSMNVTLSANGAEGGAATGPAAPIPNSATISDVQQQPATLQHLDGGFLTPPFSGESFSGEQQRVTSTTTMTDLNNNQAYQLISPEQNQLQQQAPPVLSSVQEQQPPLYLRRINRLHAHSPMYQAQA